MGLRWNAENIENFDPTVGGTHDPRLTKDMVHICHQIGMNQITKNNYREWYQRWVASRIVTQSILHNPDDWPHNPGGYVLTLAQVKAYVGLSTNASRQTDFVFRKTLAMAALDAADFHVRVQEK